MRILLVDNYSPSSINIPLKPLTAPAGSDDQTRSFYRSELAANWRKLQDTAVQCAAMARQSGGSFEFRVVNTVFKNSVWVRDSRDPDNSLAHIQVAFSGDELSYPVFRIGRSSPETVALVQDEFNRLWEKSYTPPTIR